jgi:DNA processing protein
MLTDVNKKECVYHSALILEKKIGIATPKKDMEVRKLLLEYGSFEEIYNAKSSKITNLDKLESKIEKLDFRTITIKDEDFPKHLAQYENTTPVLYVMGDVSLFSNKSVAVVGTRKLEDEIDITAGEQITERLVRAGYTVVSGLAEGCDTLGHMKAIEFEGKTIAVLGTALDSYFPAKNRELQKEIAKNHLLVSQYPIGIRTFPNFFAHRNLTTVSLSTDGIVVVRAGDRSGTLHAVRHCVEQKKPLYVLVNNFGKGYDWVEENYKYENFKKTNPVKGQ